MSRYDLYRPLSCAESLFQFFKGSDGQLIILCQSGQETVPAVSAKPDRVAGEQVFVINKINHMPPGMARYQDAFNPDVPDHDNFTVFQQNPSVIHFDLRQLIKSMDYFPPGLTGEIPVLNLSDIHCRILK